MLDGSAKKQNTAPSRITKSLLIIQFEPMMEVTPERRNALLPMSATE
jgi:hypothetical protein